MAAKDNAFAAGRAAGAGGAVAPPRQKDYPLIQAANAGFNIGRQPPPPPKPEPIRRPDGKRY